jgi:hypothetical protein
MNRLDGCSCSRCWAPALCPAQTPTRPAAGPARPPPLRNMPGAKSVLLVPPEQLLAATSGSTTCSDVLTIAELLYLCITCLPVESHCSWVANGGYDASARRSLQYDTRPGPARGNYPRRRSLQVIATVRARRPPLF